MTARLARRPTPEEAELQRKKAQLSALEAKLVQAEVDLATLRSELQTFESRYLRTLGPRFAELDELEARIAEANARVDPDDAEARAHAAEARAQARESADATNVARREHGFGKFTPSATLLELFREAARRFHPDLVTDEGERVRRTRLMADANAAYAAGDEAHLQRLLREWESDPGSVVGDDVAADLIRVIRKIAQAEDRLRSIDAEIDRLQASDLYGLKVRVNRAEAEGLNRLDEMVVCLDEQVADARRRLREVEEYA
jgi:hypothetical protein